LKKKKDDKGCNSNQVNNDNFEMQQVPARPFLFGPEKSDFDC